MKNPPAGAWLSQIEGAHSASDLVRMVREYVAGLDPDALARLAAIGTAESISGPADVQEWAVALAHLDLKANGTPDRDVFHEAAMVFAAAGARLAKVAG